MTASNRPLSPHLQIYRWQWTMTLSILHRATGVALSVGALLLVCWLLQLAGDGGGYRGLQDFLGSWFGRLLLFGWTFSLFFHLCNGIRHLVWDAGYGYELDTAYASAIAVVAASGVLTVLAWIAGYMAMGN
ncbi:MAG: succinate dehydrogenase, cytochrome b556 subunit [Acetobacterales bacterium]